MSSNKIPAQITVYTLPGCVHCSRAKALLRRRRLAFDEVDGSGAPDFRRRMATLTGGSTVPQIVIDGEPIGGADRLAALDRAGVLTAIAAGEEFPILRDIRRITPASLARWATARIRGRRDVSAARHIRITLDRAGRVIASDDAAHASEEEYDAERMPRTAR